MTTRWSNRSSDSTGQQRFRINPVNPDSLRSRGQSLAGAGKASTICRAPPKRSWGAGRSIPIAPGTQSMPPAAFSSLVAHAGDCTGERDCGGVEIPSMVAESRHRNHYWQPRLFVFILPEDRDDAERVLLLNQNRQVVAMQSNRMQATLRFGAEQRTSTFQFFCR